MKDIEWVVFDAVGTLMQPDPPVARVYWETARRYGSRLDESQVRRRFSQVFRDAEHADLNGADPASPYHLRTSETREAQRWRTIVERVLDDVTDPDACFHDLFEHFSRPAAWSFFADVAPVLRQLHRTGLRLAIASNFDERLNRIIAKVQIVESLQFCLASSTVGYRKPSWNFFKAVCRRAGCTAEKILYVGDDPVNDVAAAKRVGMSALQIARGDVESPDDSLSDLRPLIDLLARE